MTGVFVHVCCAPCYCGVYEFLVEEGLDPVGYWYNPNIQPFKEYEKRKHALERYAYLKLAEVIFEREDEYIPLRITHNLSLLEKKGLQRCRYCYALRLFQTCVRAKELGYPSFTTTLLSSHHQDHEMIRDMGTSIGKKLGLEFLYLDFRREKKRSYRISKELGLYRQNYCGCILSEWERWRDG